MVHMYNYYWVSVVLDCIDFLSVPSAYLNKGGFKFIKYILSPTPTPVAVIAVCSCTMNLLFFKSVYVLLVLCVV